MLPNLGTIYTTKMFGAAALLALAGCTDPKGPGDDSDSACLSDCDGADAGGGDGAADGSDGGPDGGDGGDGSDVPYLALTSIHPRENATGVPVDVMLEATFDSEYPLTNENVSFELDLPPDYDSPLPSTMDLVLEGVRGGLHVYRVTLTPDDPLLYSSLYYVQVAAAYSSGSASGTWEFTTVAE